MKITTITYRTNVELAPFRHAHVEMTAELEKNDDLDDALEELKAEVHRALGVDVTEDDVRAAKETLKKAERLAPKVRGGRSRSVIDPSDYE